MQKYVVATADEIPPGQRKIIKIAGKSIGIFNINGEFFAIRNRCPHGGAPLCEGVLSGFVQSPVPGEYTYTRKGEIIRCPWHQWEFDVKTGQSWVDPVKTRVRSYEAKIEQGCSLVNPAEIELEKGPFAAETFSVSLDKDYVVLEI
ncbi:Rieske (2Fe-2S) protein [Peribacillus cavernae]|uniref:Rieske (2Fe-2S) protein n=1 Tax=Peribacillus cavernae TaxID=1674310 RepID=A0A3S0U910_9BACI|nr:Rieske (2Fe-2S) protein [Peribacillus cavernae]MDQ0218124.1 3-phenylpropionate/trans-cinnamate dioxygenase ferredoxin subunit [Peribacillus cavernae]RUQ32723.1 Rieske (2Fe-2S) protein [Peribacillus cavernae]